MIFRITRISLARRVRACVVLMFCAVVSLSQTKTDKTPTASISGKVTVKNKGVAGVVVFAHQQNVSDWQRASHRGTTDQTGSYRITNLPAGTYVLSPFAPTFVLEDDFRNKSVVVAEGETLEDVNLALVQGGVITGKITDADGRPVIEEYVMVLPIDSQATHRHFVGGVHTDDRGIYRAFGLRKGKYKVYAGLESSIADGSRPSYRQTFYPSVTDAEKATVIEVTEGSETRDTDIVVGRPLKTFNVSGRIVDAETGKPLPNIKYGLSQSLGEGSSHSRVGQTVSNIKGEFKLENMLPGKYSVFIVPEASGLRADWVSFEVIDGDVADLVIKAGRSASLSGVVVLEGTEEKAASVKPRELYIDAWVEGGESNFDTNYSTPVNPDGSFRIAGLRKGRVHLGFVLPNDAAKRIGLVRVERDGVPQAGGLTLNDGEQVTGLRFVIKYLTGVIRGQVKVEGDEVVPDEHMAVWITPVDSTGDESQGAVAAPQLDSRKRFVAEGLPAGTYEVVVMVFGPGGNASRRSRQQVTVVDNAVSEVTITIKTKP